MLRMDVILDGGERPVGEPMDDKFDQRCYGTASVV